jgi:hypothetical protein
MNPIFASHANFLPWKRIHANTLLSMPDPTTSTASLSPLTSILSCVIWVLAYSVFRIPFVASFFMILTLAAGTVITYSHTPVAVSGVLMTVLLIFYYHKRNIMFLIEKHVVQKHKTNYCKKYVKRLYVIL